MIRVTIFLDSNHDCKVASLRNKKIPSLNLEFLLLEPYKHEFMDSRFRNIDLNNFELILGQRLVLFTR